MKTSSLLHFLSIISIEVEDIVWYLELQNIAQDKISLKVGHSLNFLDQSFAEKYFLGILIDSKA